MLAKATATTSTTISLLFLLVDGAAVVVRGVCNPTKFQNSVASMQHVDESDRFAQ
jgi:hypothetical protein